MATAIPALPLLGDMNADRHISRADLPILKNARNGKITNQAIIDRGDFNYNGVIDDSDIAAFLAIMEKSSTGPTP